MPFVLAQGQQGEVVIESHGIAHTVRFAIDSVRQTPVVSCLVEASEVKNGTRIAVRWPDSASSILADARPGFLSLVSTFTTLNPHLTIGAEWRVSEWPVRLRNRATDPNWSKWRPDLPTSPHWYSVERLKGLMAAEIAFAEDHGTIVACDPREARSSDQAIRMAASLAKMEGRCGAIAFSRTGDPALGDFEDAVILKTVGEVDIGLLSA
jgi:hypothetical protein